MVGIILTQKNLIHLNDLDGNRKFMSNELKDVLDQMIDGHSYSDSNTPVNPQSFKNVLQDKFTQYEGEQQHDAVEVLGNILNTLSVENKNVESTVVFNNLTMRFKIQIGCQTRGCGHIFSTTYDDTNFVLRLPVQENMTLLDLIKNYYVSEIMMGENTYKCPGCNNLNEATKTTEIYEVPKTLIVQLI